MQNRLAFAAGVCSVSSQPVFTASLETQDRTSQLRPPPQLACVRPGSDIAAKVRNALCFIRLA